MWPGRHNRGTLKHNRLSSPHTWRHLNKKLLRNLRSWSSPYQQSSLRRYAGRVVSRYRATTGGTYSLTSPPSEETWRTSELDTCA